jgi:hypothetical protein
MAASNRTWKKGCNTCGEGHDLSEVDADDRIYLRLSILLIPVWNYTISEKCSGHCFRLTERN